MLFARQFVNMFWLLLIAAGLLSLITYFLDTSVIVNLYLSLVLFFIVFLYCLLSFWEEKKSLKVIKGFTHLLPQKCIVRRNGCDRRISAEELTVGDLVWVLNGEKVGYFHAYRFDLYTWVTR